MGNASPTATVDENEGTGVAAGSHQYDRPGTYTAKTTMRDDDGGSSGVQRGIQVR